MEKYIDELGRVAVLYSPNYGAGWSSWVHTDTKDEEDFILMDKGLVELALKTIKYREDDSQNYVDFDYYNDELMEYLEKSPYPHLAHDYFGGWSDIQVYWAIPGENFYIDEYDGFERVEIYTIDNRNFHTA